MNYKNKADAERMAEYYAKKVDKEERKLVLIEKSIRECTIEVLNANRMYDKRKREAIQTDIEILDEIEENLNSYKMCRDEAIDEANMYEREEEETK